MATPIRVISWTKNIGECDPPHGVSVLTYQSAPPPSPELNPPPSPPPPSLISLPLPSLPLPSSPPHLRRLIQQQNVTQAMTKTKPTIPIITAIINQLVPSSRSAHLSPSASRVFLKMKTHFLGVLKRYPRQFFQILVLDADR
jgi:hypothetical protein